MSEVVQHTCTAAQNWGATLGECAPRCQACNQQFIELVDKESEVLAAVRDFIGADSIREYEHLLRVGREYVVLRSRALDASKGGLAR